MRAFVVSLLLLGCAVMPASARAGGRKATRVVARFGGECRGEPFRPSKRLRRMVERLRMAEHLRRQTGDPCEWMYCDYAFAYDLDGDRRAELFVRLSCGGAGNCTYGVFSDYPARQHGIIHAWFFYVHKRAGGWSALTTYGRNGGMDGHLAVYAYRKGRYVVTFERPDEGYYQHSHPFLERMGVPNCS
jgi:hypothetical protein